MGSQQSKPSDSDRYDSQFHIKTPAGEFTGRAKWKAVRGWLAILAGGLGLLVGANSGWLQGVIEKLGE